MQLLREITEKDLGIRENYCEGKFRIRRAARAVLYNDKREIALLHVCRGDYYKLPGGGQEPGEEILATLDREIMEEVGAQIEVTSELGVIIEYRCEYDMMQLSYCYLGHVKGSLGKPEFTFREVNDGFSLHWFPLEEALRLMRNDAPSSYLGRFICHRDLEFVERAFEMEEELS